MGSSRHVVTFHDPGRLTPPVYSTKSDLIRLLGP
jgi:hypothetical protein